MRMQFILNLNSLYFVKKEEVLEISSNGVDWIICTGMALTAEGCKKTLAYQENPNELHMETIPEA